LRPILFLALKEISVISDRRHRDQLKPRAEAIEPALDTDGCDRKIADHCIINAFDAGIPRGDARRRQRSFAPQTSGNERIWNTWDWRESIVSVYCQTEAWTICPSMKQVTVSSEKLQHLS